MSGEVVLFGTLKYVKGRRQSGEETAVVTDNLLARLKYGPALSLLDLSTGGAQIETSSYRLQPGSTVVVEIAAGSDTFFVPSRVLRAHVSRVLP